MVETALTVTQAVWLLPFVAPLCLYVVWSDLRAMKIPTWSTDLLALVFVVLGVFLLPVWPDYVLRFAHFGVVLAIGIGLNAIGALGAGDAKFMASAAPFIALQDVGAVLFLLVISLVAAFVVHRLCRAIPAIRGIVPQWQSWTETRRFPMGFPLGVTLVLYLATPFF